MSWSIDTDKIDLGFVNPPLGRKRYKIVSLTSQVDKKDPSGKSQFLLLKIENGKMTYTTSFYVMAKDETQQRIAQQNIAKLAKAAGISGVLKPERLKSFVGKEVEIEFKAAGPDGKYVNFVAAYPISDEEPEEVEEEQEEESEEEEEETPAASIPPWKKK